MDVAKTMRMVMEYLEVFNLFADLSPPTIANFEVTLSNHGTRTAKAKSKSQKD
jgi:hypothetical protein